jgi:RHS repeat-associated protein
LDDVPVAMVDSTGASPVLYFIHTDQLGTPQKLTDGSMNVVWDGVFDPFGNPAPGASLGLTNLRFPGQYFDAESNLHQNWVRSYDPRIGRYVQSDIIGLRGGINTYAYGASEPTTKTDPFGLWQITIQGGAGFGGRVTFGNNGGSGLFDGQWNFGTYGGEGLGLSLDIDIFNRGCKAPGRNIGFEGEGEIGLGPHITAEAHAGGDQWWNINVGLPGIPYLGGSIGTEGVTVPTIGIGESIFTGLGGTRYY